MPEEKETAASGKVASRPCLTRDTIKYIAILTMLLNHIATALLPPESVWFEILVDIGYFTAVTMCFFLVEGYRYTHSRKNYALRLLVFALISQVPYGALQFGMLNMLFTLFFCFLILQARHRTANGFVRNLLVTLLLLGILDWGCKNRTGRFFQGKKRLLPACCPGT